MIAHTLLVINTNSEVEDNDVIVMPICIRHLFHPAYMHIYFISYLYSYLFYK